jgi:hypothetical protein
MNLLLHKRREISWLGERLAASEEGLRAVELRFIFYGTVLRARMFVHIWVNLGLAFGFQIHVFVFCLYHPEYGAQFANKSGCVAATSVLCSYIRSVSSPRTTVALSRSRRWPPPCCYRDFCKIFMCISRQCISSSYIKWRQSWLHLRSLHIRLLGICSIWY